MFRRHGHLGSDRWRWRLLDCRPATVLFVATSALAAGIIEQPLRGVSPDRLGPIQPHRVDQTEATGSMRHLQRKLCCCQRSFT